MFKSIDSNSFGSQMAKFNKAKATVFVNELLEDSIAWVHLSRHVMSFSLTYCHLHKSRSCRLTID